MIVVAIDRGRNVKASQFQPPRAEGIIALGQRGFVKLIVNELPYRCKNAAIAVNVKLKSYVRVTAD